MLFSLTIVAVKEGGALVGSAHHCVNQGMGGGEGQHGWLVVSRLRGRTGSLRPLLRFTYFGLSFICMWAFTVFYFCYLRTGMAIGGAFRFGNADVRGIQQRVFLNLPTTLGLYVIDDLIPFIGVTST